jgi:hypothetical protein
MMARHVALQCGGFPQQKATSGQSGSGETIRKGGYRLCGGNGGKPSN